MKTVVVYYTLNGNSKLVSEKIAKRLDADLVSLECTKAYPASGPLKFIVGGKDAAVGATPELKPYTFVADAYDLVILATPVWASRCSTAFNTFLRDNDLSGVRVAFAISSSGGDATKCARDIKNKLHLDDGTTVPVLSLRDPASGRDPDLDSKIDQFCDVLRG